MKEKTYRYKELIYSNEDQSLERKDYGGDLYDLYYELKRDGKVREDTLYYKTESENYEYYDDHEQLIEEEFGHLEVTEGE